MKSFTTSGMLLLLLTMLATGCERRDLTYYLESEITVTSDWNSSGLEERGYGATVVFYPHDGGEPIPVLMGDREQTKVRLPEGVYDALIFNRKPEDFGGIVFESDGTIGNLEAHAREMETRMDPATKKTTRVIVKTPEELASDAIWDFAITGDMLGNYSDVMNPNKRDTGGQASGDPERYHIHFVPKPLTIEVQVKIDVPGINSLRSAVGILENVSESVRLCSCEPSKELVSEQFALPDIRYNEGSPFDGVLSGQLNVFGFDDRQAHRLTFRGLLVDGSTIVERTVDTTSEREVKEDGSILIRIRAQLDKLPDVKPEGGSDSGFDVNVGDWGDPEHEEIPL